MSFMLSVVCAQCHTRYAECRYAECFYAEGRSAVRLAVSVTRKLNKISPNFWEKVAENANISTPGLNLKAQNWAKIELLLKPYNKPQVESACLGEN
jgi:hypothetical protein